MISNHFKHGAKLKAELLQRDFNCSASSVREALFRLSTEGLVNFIEQRGFRVPQKSPVLLIELTHMRVLLESEGAVLSMQKGGVAWEAKLSAAHYKLSHVERRIHSSSITPDLVQIWFSSEREFHETLISECNSETLIQLHSRIYDQFRQQLMEVDRKFSFISESIKQHAEILNAVLLRDETLTRQSIEVHLARHLTGTTLDA